MFNIFKYMAKMGSTAEEKLTTSVDEPAAEDSETLELVKEMQMILNELTPSNFTQLMQRILSLKIDTEKKLRDVVDLSFEKAVNDPTYCEAYGDMCHRMIEIRVMPDNVDGQVQHAAPTQPIEFRRVLLVKCQKEFEMMIEAEKKMNLAPWGKESESETLLSKRYLGIIQFIGQLYKNRILIEGIMHNCITCLLKTRQDTCLEGLCALLNTVGKDLDNKKGKQKVDEYFKQLGKIIQDKKTAPRILNMMQKLCDLRRNNWVPSVVTEAPMTIGQSDNRLEGQKEQETPKREVKSAETVSAYKTPHMVVASPTVPMYSALERARNLGTQKRKQKGSKKKKGKGKTGEGETPNINSSEDGSTKSNSTRNKKSPAIQETETIATEKEKVSMPVEVASTSPPISVAESEESYSTVNSEEKDVKEVTKLPDSSTSQDSTDSRSTEVTQSASPSEIETVANTTTEPEAANGSNESSASPHQRSDIDANGSPDIYEDDDVIIVGASFPQILPMSPDPANMNIITSSQPSVPIPQIQGPYQQPLIQSAVQSLAPPLSYQYLGQPQYQQTQHVLQLAEPRSPYFYPPQIPQYGTSMIRPMTNAHILHPAPRQIPHVWTTRSPAPEGLEGGIDFAETGNGSVSPKESNEGEENPSSVYEFSQIKAAALGKADLGIMASVHREIYGLICYINNQQDYFITSACSGRIQICSVDSLRPEAKDETCFAGYFLSHAPTTWNALNQCLKNLTDPSLFKFEPVVLYVQCRTIKSSKILYRTAIRSGFNNSGVIFGDGEGEITVAVRGTGCMEIPLTGVSGKRLTSDVYIELITNVANQRLLNSWKKIKTFEGSLIEVLNVAEMPEVSSDDKE